MVKYPKVTFIQNTDTEANRILHASVQVGNGFYFKKHFAVLPYLVSGNAGTVHLPKLPYHTIPQFWDFHKDNTNLPLNYSPEMVKKVKALLPTIIDDKEKLQKYKEEWSLKENAFWELFTNLFPTHIQKIDEIEVRVTQYGTKVSFDRITMLKNKKIHIYLRNDMPVDQVAEAIIHCSLYGLETKLNLSWEGMESIADFIMNSLQEKGIFTEFKPTLANLCKTDDKLLEKSSEYLKELGLHFEQPFTIKNEIISLYNKPISGELTALQQLILSRCIKNAGKIVTYDELSDIIWPNEENFSLWAINKQMQRLRNKLTMLGADKKSLHPVKGKGYSLINS